MLDQLTIVIITYKRYGHLKRLLGFYSSYQSQARVLVLDSSPEYPEDEKLINLLSRDNVSWKRYDQGIYFVQKIAEGCKHIKTDYAVLCADDDFLIPPSLEACIDFLSEHQDYASAHGLYFIHSNANELQKHMFHLCPLYLQGRSSEEKTSAERVTSYLGGITVYYPMYAVHRTPTFSMIWDETKQYVTDHGLSELFPCSLSFVYGKMKILPIFYNSREPNNYISWHDEKLQARAYSEEKLKRAVIGLSKQLNKHDGLSLEEAESVLQNAFQAYLSKTAKKLKSQNSAEAQVFILFLKRIKNKLEIRRRIIYVKNYLLYEGCHPSIYPDYLEDFKKVREAVYSAGLTFEDLKEARK